MNGLEVKLDEWLVKKAPFQLPENGRKGLVSALPWLTLAGGVLMLLLAWWAYQVISAAERFAAGIASGLNFLYGAGYVAPVATYSPLMWVSLALLVVEAIMFFAAFPALQTHKKSGWNLLFWVALLNVVEVVLQAFGYFDFAQFIFSLLGTIVGLYLLFQVRSYFTPAGSAPVAGGSNDTMKTPKETLPADKPAETPVDHHDHQA